MMPTERTTLDSELHKSLLQKLHDKLSTDMQVYKGTVQIIAGEKTRHKPDVICYHRGKKFWDQPILYEVENCNSILSETTISKSRLFSDTAQNLSSKFYFVVPKNCKGVSGNKLAKEMLNENAICNAEIMIL